MKNINFIIYLFVKRFLFTEVTKKRQWNGISRQIFINFEQIVIKLSEYKLMLN